MFARDMGTGKPSGDWRWVGVGGCLATHLAHLPERPCGFGTLGGAVGQLTCTMFGTAL